MSKTDRYHVLPTPTTLQYFVRQLNASLPPSNQSACIKRERFFADVGYFAGAMAAVAVAGGIKYEQLQAPSAGSGGGHLASATAVGATSLQSGGCSGGGADGSSNLTVTHLGPSFLAHRASCAGTSSPTHPPSSLSPPPPAGLPNSKAKNIKYAVGAEHHMLANMYKPNSMGS